MPDNFFTWEPDSGSSYFAIEHILFVVLGISFCVLMCFLLRKIKIETSQKILRAIAIIALVFDPVYWIWEYLVSGTIHFRSSLPLYFCSLFYLVMPFAFFSKNKIIRECSISYLATMNLIAGLMGLIFNTNLIVYPLFSFVGLRTMTYHTLMVFVSMFVWTSKCYRPKITHTFLFFVPVTAVFIPALIADMIYKADYCFLGGGFGTPFEIISNAVPMPLYILILYFGIYFLNNLIFYIPTILQYGKKLYKVNKSYN